MNYRIFFKIFILTFMLIMAKGWGATLKSIEVADNAYGFISSQDGKRAYIATQYCTGGTHSQVDAIDLETNNVVGHVYLPGCMHDELFLSSDDNKLYAASGSTIFIIDVSSLKVIKEIKLKKDHYVVYGSISSFDKKKIFYSIRSNFETPLRYFLVLDIDTDKVITTIPFSYSTNISGLTISHDGKTLFITPQPLYEERQKVFAVDVESKNVSLVGELPIYIDFKGFMLSPDDKYFYASGAEPKNSPGDEVTDWDIFKIDRQTFRMEKIYNSEHPIIASAISHDANKLYIIDHRRGHEGILILDSLNGSIIERITVPDENTIPKITKIGISTNLAINNVYFTTKAAGIYNSMFNIIYF